MPRTLPAALTTAMDSGSYEPYIRVVVNEEPTDTGAETIQPLGYTLRALTAKIKMPNTQSVVPSYFRIVRGALISGTPSTISTIWFQTINYAYDGKFLELEGEVLPRDYLSIAANSDYETVIETALTRSLDTILPNYEGAAAWKAYQFYPTGKNIILSPRKKLFTILQQKYIVFAAEDGFDGTDNNIFFFVATQTRAEDYSVTDILFDANHHTEFRKVIWRDEANTVHSVGNATDIIHNLGFLHSTAADPIAADTPINQHIGSRSSKLAVHLKYRTGDYVHFPGDGGLNDITQRINVLEILDLESTPTWYMILETLVWFGSTEGGPLPSTIEAAAPYTPLATGNFDAVLSANDNNIQAAMETIDDHDHAGGAAFTEVVQDIIGAMLSGNTETGITVTYQDSDGTIDFEVAAHAAPITTNMLTRSPDSVGQGTWARAVNTSFLYNAFFGNIATSANGDNFTINMYLPAGTYKLRFNAVKSSNRAIVKVEVGATNLGNTDLYAAASDFLNVAEYTGIVIATSAVYAVKFTANGKNASSSSHVLTIEGIEFIRTA